jgi:hypothetical protein
MQDLLFDTPLWILAGLAVVGIALFIVGNNRTDRTLRNVGAAVVGLGVLLLLLSWFVDTDKEQCVHNTRALAKSVQDRDWTTFNKLVGDHCTLRVPAVGTIYRDRDALQKATAIAADKFGLKDNSVLHVEPIDGGTFIKVGLNVLSQGNMGYPLTTSWELEWEKFPQGWELTDLNAIRIGQDTGTKTESYFPHVSP